MALNAITLPARLPLDRPLPHPSASRQQYGAIEDASRSRRCFVAGMVFVRLAMKGFRSRGQVKRAAVGEGLFSPQKDIALEVLGGKARKGDSKVSLVCVHGSYHAAWCYESFYLDFFREHGVNAYAISLRGQGAGKMQKQPAVAGTLEEHAADVASFVRELEKEGQQVVLLGHSFGGLITLRAALDLDLAGLILLCSVPPSGNVGIILRSLFRAPLQAFRITWGFISRAFERDAELCQELFFDKETPITEVQDYMELMKKGCPANTRLLDLRQLQKSLPVPINECQTVLVLGGEMDVIVDSEALEETAKAYGVKAKILPGVAHDAMLGSRWRQSAETILEWLKKTQDFAAAKASWRKQHHASR